MNRLLIIYALVCFVSGCGSSGQDNPPTSATVATPDPNLTVPFQPAFARLITEGFSKPFTLSGSNNQSGSGQLTVGAGDPTFTLNGEPYIQSIQVATVGSIGVTAVSYFHGDDFSPYMSTILGGETTVYDRLTFPATAKAGDTGITAAGTTTGFTPTPPDHCGLITFFHTPETRTTQGSYVVSGDGMATLLVMFIQDGYSDRVGHVNHTQTVYRIDTEGAASLVSVTTHTYLCGGDATVVLTF